MFHPWSTIYVNRLQFTCFLYANSTVKRCAKQWPKIKAVFTDMIPICDALKLTAQDCNPLDQSFMYTHILKEILLTTDIEQKHFMEFTTNCQKQFVGSLIKPTENHTFQWEYHCDIPFWWYMYQCGSPLIMNQDSHPINVNTIVKMGFLIGDLHLHIPQIDTEQSGNLYYT